MLKSKKASLLFSFILVVVSYNLKTSGSGLMVNKVPSWIKMILKSLKLSQASSIKRNQMLLGYWNVQVSQNFYFSMNGSWKGNTSAGVLEPTTQEPLEFRLVLW